MISSSKKKLSLFHYLLITSKTSRLIVDEVRTKLLNNSCCRSLSNQYCQSTAFISQSLSNDPVMQNHNSKSMVKINVRRPEPCTCPSCTAHCTSTATNHMAPKRTHQLALNQFQKFKNFQLLRGCAPSECAPSDSPG